MPDTQNRTSGAVTATSESTPANAWEDFATVLDHAIQAQAENDLKRAYAFFARATELDPNCADAWAGRATSTSNLDDAITSWGYVLTLAPDHATGRHALERGIADRTAQSTADQAPVLVALGRRLAEGGHRPYGYTLVRRATELDESNQDAWLWRAGLTDDTQETIACLNQTLALNPNHARAQAGLKWTLTRETGAQAPMSPDVRDQAHRMVEHGRQMLQLGNKPSAYALFKRATEAAPQHELAWLWRGSTTADVDEALVCVEHALAINPDNASARQARSWLRTKKLRERNQSPAAVAPAPPAAGVPTHAPRRLRPSLAVLAVLILILLALAATVALTGIR